MRIGFLALFAAGCVVTGSPAPAPGAYDDVRRVVAALDDLAADYPTAVQRGAVIDPTRMKVLRHLLHDAEVYARYFPDGDRAALRQIADAVAGHADPQGVVAEARALRRRLLVDHQIILGPAAPPDRARAEQLWLSQCAACHGTVGAGDGPQSYHFAPEPKDFHEPEFMANLAPSRAFSRIADGVPQTAMPAWGMFSNSERWGLAFLVFSFRHDYPEVVARGRAAVARLADRPAPRDLADRTDTELAGELRRAGLDETAAEDAVAYLRSEGAFQPPAGRLGAIRTRLAGAMTRYRARLDAEAAAELAAARRDLATRIDGIRAADPEVAGALEHRLATLSAAITDGALTDLVEQQILRIDVLLVLAPDAPEVGGGARLVLEWAAAAALGLGLLLGRRRGDGRIGWRPPALGLALGGALGAALAPASPGSAAVALGAAAALALALAAPMRHRDRLLAAAAAALVGVALGASGRALVAAGGPVPWLAGVAAIAAIGAAAYLSRADRHAAGAVVEAIALAIAAAASAGRGLWILVATTTEHVQAWRIDALGLYPARVAIVAAAIAAALVLLARLRAR